MRNQAGTTRNSMASLYDLPGKTAYSLINSRLIREFILNVGTSQERCQWEANELFHEANEISIL